MTGGERQLLLKTPNQKHQIPGKFKIPMAKFKTTQGLLARIIKVLVCSSVLPTGIQFSIPDQGRGIAHSKLLDFVIGRTP